MVASLDAVDALGLEGATVRINDRRVLDWMLDSFGFTAEERPGVLITIDKLDKIGPEGVAAELHERSASTAAADAFDAFLRRPQTMEYNPFGERQIRKALPDGAPAELIEHRGIGSEAVAAGRGQSDIRSSSTRSSCAAWGITPARSSSSRTRLSHTRSAAAGVRRHDRSLPRAAGARGRVLAGLRASGRSDRR